MQTTPVVAAFIAGIIVGAGALYVAGPSLFAAGPPGLEIPSNEEASAAMAKAKNLPSTTVRLGQCDRNTMGPGVSCVVDWDRAGDGKAIVATVGFSKSASGQWVAVHYF